MHNELVLIVSLIIIYLGVILFYKMFGKIGLYMWTVIATISANIEVLILVNAFGMEQTLGNILFASTFLVTDILSELEDKKSANKAVHLGIVSSICFILITQSWFLYIPNANDWAMPFIKSIFSNTPRLMIVGISVYAIAQVSDVWLYHFIWHKTSKMFGDTKKGLWIRNNGSTLVSQLINTILFTFGAFWGVYDFITLINILISSYVIFIVTSLLDTPAVYLARKLKYSKSI
ncbi:transporter [Candidatus Epulonipiscioides gigas]|nr:transporter [Epulopiscium sp. SCG-C07WGA-EpuloA2]